MMAGWTKPVVALLAVPDTSPSVLYGLYDVLLSVGAVHADMTTGEPGEAMLDVKIVAADHAPFRSFGGVLVEPHASIADVARADVVIVGDMYAPIYVAPHGKYQPEIAWLQRLHAHGTMIASVCTGTLLLAEAGLLDGRECATHWALRDLFRMAYPRIRLREESILNVNSERYGVVTAGGATAWQDLALHVIGRLCGPDHALKTAKGYLLANHDDGQLPFAAMNRYIQKTDALIGECQAWIADNFVCPNPIAAMTARSGLKPRTFARRFRQATGYLPIEYVHALRIDAAKQIIDAEDGSLDDIASRVGYEDTTFFRRLFKRTVGLTPAAYRRKFRSILAIQK